MCGSLSSDGSMCVLSVGHDGYHATVTEPIETSAGGCFWWDITSAQRDQDQSYASAGLGRAVTKAVQLVHSRNVAAGWWSDPKTGERKDRNVGELLCLVHSEISEAMEGHRRLTPTECERLQGFPDGYTAVTHRKKPAADGNRYKALGNSWAVPVAKWICERIQLVDRLQHPDRTQQSPMQSKVIAGERVVYSPGSVMGFEFLEHVAEPKPKWTTPKIQVLELNQAHGHHPGPLCDKHGSLSGGVCQWGK